MDPNITIKSGVNLTDIVNLNVNPLDIIKFLYPTLSSWNAFQAYLHKNNFVLLSQFYLIDTIQYRDVFFESSYIDVYQYILQNQSPTLSLCILNQ